MNPQQVLSSLAEIRPVFHSEADFQHAFAWRLQNAIPKANIRLEYRPRDLKKRGYIDVWLRLPNGLVYAFELKYKSRRLTFDHGDETFDLTNQGAQDLGRYDYLKDIARLETLVGSGRSIHGVAILLTNDATYWTESKRLGTATVDSQFRLHEGKRISGKLVWGKAASAGTMKAREGPIEVLREYDLGWSEYCELPNLRNGRFRYLLTYIKGT